MKQLIKEYKYGFFGDDSGGMTRNQFEYLFNLATNSDRSNYQVSKWAIVQLDDYFYYGANDKTLAIAATIGGMAAGSISGAKPNWTPHKYKHFAGKNIPWKDVVKSTKSGPAKYLNGTDVEALEQYVWGNGLNVANGKSWKVMRFDEIIGASEGVETRFRVEYSGGTIHSHPITEAEFIKLTK